MYCGNYCKDDVTPFMKDKKGWEQIVFRSFRDFAGASDNEASSSNMEKPDPKMKKMKEPKMMGTGSSY